jgi:REP element-mobilizing transposase RayT
MAGTFTKLLYHVVFSTKGREPLIGPDLRPELQKYIGGIIRGERGILLEIGGTADHLHVVARFRADVSVAEMARLIKCNSSKWANERPDRRFRFEWQSGYGAFTVSESQLEGVRHYVQGQEEHHRKRTFKEEFVAMLEKHGMEYDERYLWD